VCGLLLSRSDKTQPNDADWRQCDAGADEKDDKSTRRLYLARRAAGWRMRRSKQIKTRDEATRWVRDANVGGGMQAY
jgi:hypothetical protein